MKTSIKSMSAVLGATFLATMAQAPIAAAVDNPFVSTELAAGYQLAGKDAEGKCGEGKCGDNKKAAMADDMHSDMKSATEGKCGEAKCGANK
jgi:uncharacterized low-complexity protein